MRDILNDKRLLPLIEAVIDGGVTATEAGRGLPLDAQDVLEIAESLGQLKRDRPAGFTPIQAGILYDLIESTVDAFLSGKRARTPKEQVAKRLTDLAFEVGDPMAWAVILGSIRDGRFPGDVSTKSSATSA